MSFNITPLLWVVSSYLIGSISFARVASLIFRLPDPTSYGSKNPGATNVMRSGHRSAAILTFLGDFSKGWCVTWWALQLGLTEWWAAGVISAVILGHMWPIWHGFHGGKGVATAFGILLGLYPTMAFACLAVWLLFAITLKISALAALAATVVVPVISWIHWGAGHPFTILCMALTILVVGRHHENIRSLWSRCRR